MNTINYNENKKDKITSSLVRLYEWLQDTFKEAKVSGDFSKNTSVCSTISKTDPANSQGGD